MKDSRSRVTNDNTLFLGDVDGRGIEARRFRDVYSALIEALGGREELSEAQLMLCRKTSGLEVMTERLESKIAAGEEVDHGSYTRAVGTLARLLERLGLVPLAIPVRPRNGDSEDDPDETLEEYLERTADREPRREVLLEN